MGLRAVLFDVGDTIVEHWAPRERVNALRREALRREFGERDWYDRLLDADLGPFGSADGAGAPEMEESRLRQETLRWYEDWLRGAAVRIDDISLDRLRIALTVPLDLVSTPVPGAFGAVRWCSERGLKVALVTNTLARGDEDVWEDMRRFGLADAIDAVVSSHSTGWLKPHPRIFERALALTSAEPADAVMIGDRLDADVWGASRLGMRTILRRTPSSQPALDVRPDAILDDLTRLPATLEAWLGPPAAR